MKIKQDDEIEYYSEYIYKTLKRLRIDDLYSDFDKIDIVHAIYHQIILTVLTLPIFINKDSDFKSRVISNILEKLKESEYFDDNDILILNNATKIFYEISKRHVLEIEINNINSGGSNGYNNKTKTNR